MSLSEDEVQVRLKRALVASIHRTGDSYKGAIEELEAIARTGHAHAKFLLGKELLCGGGKKTQENEERAKDLFREAGRAGDVGALIALANLEDKPPALKLKLYHYAASVDHPVGCFNLGMQYIDGVNIEQDSHKGLDLCQRAADLNDPDSCVRFARWCILGDFIARNEIQGVKYLRKSIQHGTAHGLNEKAYLHLSNCLLHGIGTEKNVAECIKLLEDGARRSHSEVMFRLGLLYSTGGFGVTDHLKAKQWFETASANGSGAADYHLGLVHFRAKGAMKRPQKAKDCFHQALNRGYRRAANHLVVIYQTGIDGVSNPNPTYVRKLQDGKSEAEKKYIVIKNNVPDITGERSKLFGQLLDATKSGDPDATFYLSKLFADGTADGTVTRDDHRAVSLMRTAAMDGHADALWYMARHYRNESNVVEAERCLEEAVRLEHPDALCSAAYHSIRKQDVARAITLYERAGEIGYGKALFNLALIYHRGEGVNRSARLARKYFEAASHAGYARASHNMGMLTEKEMPKTIAQGWYGRSRNGEEEVSSSTNVNLGHMHLKKGELDTAKEFFEKAALANNIQGMKWLAQLLLTKPDATKKDRTAGMEWKKRFEAVEKSRNSGSQRT